MPVSLRDRTIRNEFERLFGFKPDGRNKFFKDIKTKYNNPNLNTPKNRREFLQQVIKDKQNESAMKIQKLRKNIVMRKQKYINNFKQQLLNKNEIILKRNEINRNTNILQLLEIIQDNVNTNDEYVFVKINGRNYTLSTNNINMIINMVRDGGDIEESNYEYVGSDGEMTYDLLFADTITIIKKKKTNKYKNTEGAFFPYYLNEDININLTSLQIYKNSCSDVDRNLDNCLFYALKLYGINENKLEQIKDMIKLKHIPLKDLEIVCKKLNIKIILWKRKDCGRLEKTIFGKCNKIEVDIGYIENHYFLVQDSIYTTYSIKNYDIVKDKEEFNKIYDKRGWKCEDRKINTFGLISLMMENKDYFFTKINAGNVNKYDEIYINKLQENNFECLDYTDEDYRLVEFDKTKIEPDLEVDDKTKILYFDFETGEYDINGEIHVKPYLACTIDNEGNKKSFVGVNCAYQLLKSLNQNTILIAHNAKFDYTFLTNHLWKCKEICNGSAFITFTGYFGKHKIQIKDSYRLIAMPLSDFPKAFKLNYHKEFMPYKLYNEYNIEKRYIDYNDVLKYVNNDKNKKIFDENIVKWNLSKNGKIDMIEYSRRYCEIDVELLKDGYNIFRDNCISHFNIDVNKILTIPSLADKYFIIQGCYDGVYELAGQPRQFIQNCIIGGRTMCCENQKQKLTNVKINDFDAVSLYPSAMARMNGFLKGLPKVITNLDYNVVKNYDGYFVQIKIKKIGIKRKFSLISYLDDTGVRNFTNDVVDKIIYVDKTGLEDLIKFQDIEFEIIKGYYFDEGFNNKINEVIKFVFNKRVQLKKEKNVGQLIYKLIMNSGYGKSIQKSHDDETKLFDTRERFDVYLSKNYNKIKSFVEYDEGRKYKATIGSTMTNHFNRCHVGVEILSMSKRIMNEVMCLAEDNNLNIYYQDTDSIHIQDKDIKILQQKFKQKYKRELIGEELGQFHSDFELHGANKNIVATDSIFLGKKSYIDRLTGEDNEGNEVQGYHFRMKGIPSKVVEYYCDENNINLFELYEKLYNGDKIKFDLTRGGDAFCIKHQKNYTINVLPKFDRVVCF